MLAAVGQPVPDAPHAVSVSLPSWKATVGYEEGEDWVVSKMQTGYPRFFIHLTIRELENEILKQYGKPQEHVMLFPSPATAKLCQRFFYDKLESLPVTAVRLLNLEPNIGARKHVTTLSGVYCVFFPKEHASVAKQVWQHSGDGISSRRGEFCLKALRDGLLQPVAAPARIRADSLYSKGPRRYQRGGSQNGINFLVQPPPEPAVNGEESVAEEDRSYAQFVEERFGRNLNVLLASKAKLAIRRRIAGCLIDPSDLDEALAKPLEGCDRRIKGLSEEDVYLYPTGMSSIFNAHRILMANERAHERTIHKSICFGFPYVDTLKILQKWGPGCLFYGHGNSADLDDLERRLASGERYLALFTEFPSNPLLNSPDLVRIHGLAEKYSFAVVIDETISNFINCNVAPYTDIIVSSLTKVFSGDSNVMGGSLVLNPNSSRYAELSELMTREYEDNYWAEDAVFMERNSRDFIPRIHRINANTEAIAKVLLACPFAKQVYYPLYSPTRANYEVCKTPSGGYGGLLSVTFKRGEQAVAFFDALAVQKGPSLGTNFTLSCPFVILAHYGELEWAKSVGVEQDLVRISVGLEEEAALKEICLKALEAASKA
ncbi:hypothetical protein DV737_g718, partial [Chaetothyriales sp. CBS 132003]